MLELLIPGAQAGVGDSALAQSLCMGMNYACTGCKSVTFQESEGPSSDAAFWGWPTGPGSTVCKGPRRSNQNVLLHYPEAVIPPSSSEES